MSARRGREEPMTAEEEHEARLGRDHAFDTLARELAGTNVSRSYALKSMGKALLGATLFATIPGVAWARPSGRGPGGSQGCPQPGQSSCRGNCVFLGSDPNNCGKCGNVCPSTSGAQDFCINGVCQPRCGPGETLCNGGCSDLNSDPANCGRCGNVCPIGQRCSNGTCQEPVCSIGETLCHYINEDGQQVSVCIPEGSSCPPQVVVP
jgi:hypothetical protein